jgi:hypothetical protein
MMDENRRMTFRNGKRFRVSVTFPEISASHSHQDAEANGGNMRVAVNRALQEIFARRHVKGRRLTYATIRVTKLGERLQPDREGETE